MEIVDPCQWSVRFKAAARVLPEPFGLARENMDAILQKNASGRDELLMAYGDCKKIAHIRQLLVKLKEVLPSNFTGKDDRMERCSYSCACIEDVLKDNGLESRLREMMESERSLIEVMLVPANLEQIEAPVLERAITFSEASRQALLEDIDTLLDDDESRDKALEKMELLFSYYADGWGLLEGPSYTQAVDDVTKYVKKEWDERNEIYREEGKEKLAVGLGEFDEAKRKWVLSVIDVDGDGCITKSEMMHGFKKCVKEIDCKQMGATRSLR